MLKWAARRILAKELDGLHRKIDLQGDELDAMRSRADLGMAFAESFYLARKQPEYEAAFTAADPLVTVCVATYNRADMLVERCLPSIIAQTHRNLEIIVIGDACTDDTAARVEALGDPRIRFENLPERGRYPEDPHRRWMVAGTVPINRGLSLARGQFITHLDDDDTHEPDRVTKLLALARKSRADLVWHPFLYETPDGRWKVNKALEFRKNRITTSSVLYHRWLARVPWDLEAHHYLEPGDWNRFRKLKWLGVKAVRHPDLLLRHYRERSGSR